MTRKKWNRLRRQRPELFARLPSWCRIQGDYQQLFQHLSKSEIVTKVSAYVLANGPLQAFPGDMENFYMWQIFGNPGSPEQIALTSLKAWA